MRSAFVSLSLILVVATCANSGSPAQTEHARPSPSTGAWDVNNPPGPKHDIRIDTDEATWMDIDVSPNGDTIVFDLLGDIYTIPIAGGDARQLTGGMAWDMQPRFSPDGKSIAFISDRDGGENIWIMARDGSGLRQISKERIRLVNSPAWSPDGAFIAGRRNFTAARIDSGEVWAYSLADGSAVQLTKRPNDYSEAGEPAFSPDGRYLYWTQDVSSTQSFEYNRDPHGELYAIKRLDRRTGETLLYIRGLGGSIRPTPSHDGKQIAFVRRVADKTVLFVADVKSGRQRALYDGLDRDMQETLAMHGFYPQMAWMPDDRGIVFWAGGRINRIDVETRRASVIPFHVKTVLTVQEALRSRGNAWTEKFPVRMLRWARVSPRGDRVVYSALGYLYERELPDGFPRRVTKQSEDFEFYPQFSRDGKWIVYTTWNDRKLGAVCVVPSDGGEPRRLTTEPGRYVEPTFSPDGRLVVYRSAPVDRSTASWSHAGSILGLDYSQDIGLYSIAIEGGEPRLIAKEGTAPQFGTSGDRLFVTTQQSGQTVLISIDLQGGGSLKLASSHASEYAISPDEKWVAWVEYFRVHAAPLFAGEVQQPNGPATTSAFTAAEGGAYLGWSADSRTLYWSSGSELFSRSQGGSQSGAGEAQVRHWNIGFEERSDAPSGQVAFVGATILTMNGNQTIADGTLVVDGNKIVTVGPRASVGVPPGAKKIDVRGATIMPGIIDVHWHGKQGQDGMIPQQNWFDYAALAFGVTTIHDPAATTGEIFTASEMEKAGLVRGPRIFSTGTPLFGADRPGKAPIDSLEDARFHVGRLQGDGAFTIKSYAQLRRDQRQQIIEAARELGMMVVPEGASDLPFNLTMVADGHTGIEHCLPVARIYGDVEQFWAGTKVGLTPTLIVAYGGIFGENYWYEKTNVWQDQRLMSFVPPYLVYARALRPTAATANGEWNHIDAARVTARLAADGVSVQLGAHGQRQGLGAHWEIWMMVQGGMTPMRALEAATISGARYLGLDGQIGSLAPGRLADFIVLDRNPIENIRNTESVRYTVVNGRVFDAATMNEIGNHPQARQPFFFEMQQ